MVAQRSVRAEAAACLEPWARPEGEDGHRLGGQGQEGIVGPGMQGGHGCLPCFWPGRSEARA